MLRSIAFIPDGNRRYAAKNGLNFARAYSAGFEKTRQVFEWCLDVPKLNELTVWTISTENLSRTGVELSVFTRLLNTKLVEAKNDPLVTDNGVKVNVIGRLEMLPYYVQEAASELIRSTAENTGRVLNLAIGYGGRQELVDAVQSVVAAGLPATEENISSALYTSTEPDLIVRTGDTQRLSGFMPWQSAYSELYFSKKLWPEFTRSDFDEAVSSFSGRARRFGL
ncbi:MAG: di-trans,poly-cis-decaprenylcistransferase [Candidatus Diapherotrites archaeon]|nr:di-trans,poly-cis-decaprenylcistransferase [Candidatus Diapherotrites archaeon]